MEVTLKRRDEELVRKHLAAGDYSDPSELIGDALRLFEQQQELRAAIQEGVASIERGDYVDIPAGQGAAYAERVHERGMERLAKEKIAAE